MTGVTGSISTASRRGEKGRERGLAGAETARTIAEAGLGSQLWVWGGRHWWVGSRLLGRLELGPYPSATGSQELLRRSIDVSKVVLEESTSPSHQKGWDGWRMGCRDQVESMS